MLRKSINANMFPVEDMPSNVNIFPTSIRPQYDVQYRSTTYNADVTQLQSANSLFDPNNGSPMNEFMKNLKTRMSVYYKDV